ncbi:ribbon-helix-helix domain-containing protein [Oleisolibacter albus]|uniref:ribbon-helix-helix domain-containing protein n=1 Tax=Oleisolibacter albus TaxID=2171757 RepID=UPI000DF154D9|nr:ribbon-helix-helix protein, CopG family [Oleisolibacter albus]
MSPGDLPKIALTPELLATIKQVVASGEYNSSSAVIREALEQWKERRDLLGHSINSLRLLWEDGLASGRAEEGEGMLEVLVKRYRVRGNMRGEAL